MDQLCQEFSAFVAADTKDKERQFAQTRLIEVQQDIEKRLVITTSSGEPRRVCCRRPTSALSATTILTTTEELMLSVPGYWLAPALVALSVGGLLGLAFLSGGAILFGLIVAGAAAYFYSQHRALEQARANAREQLEAERDHAARTLGAALAELVHLRRDISTEDANAEKVIEFSSVFELAAILSSTS